MSRAPAARSGSAASSRAAPDGYTLTIGNWATHVSSGASYPVQYDLLNDLEPVAKLADTPLWMVAKNALPVKDMKELIAWLKANQDKASAGIVGTGSGGHICGLSFQSATGTRYQFVSYRGGAPAMQDLRRRTHRLHVRHGGELAAAGACRQHQAHGRHVEDALVRGARRADRRGDGRAGPRHLLVARHLGTQGHAQGRRRQAQCRGRRARSADPAVRKRFVDLGQEIPPREQQTPDGFAAFHKAEIEKWWPVIKGAGIKNE